MAESDLPFEVVTETPGLKVFLSSAGKYYVATYEGFRYVYSHVKRSGNHHVFKCSPGDKPGGRNRCPGKLFLDQTYTRVVDGPLNNGVSRTHNHSPNQQKCIDRYEYYKALHEHARKAAAATENCLGNSDSIATDGQSNPSIPSDVTSTDSVPALETSKTATPNPATSEVNTDAPQAPPSTSKTQEEPGTSSSKPGINTRNHPSGPTTALKSVSAARGAAFKHISINLNQIRRQCETANGSTNKIRSLLNEIRDSKILESLNDSQNLIATAVGHIRDSAMDSAEALQHLVVTDVQKAEKLDEIDKKLGVLADNIKLQTEVKKRKLELLEEMVVLKKRKQASLEEIVAIKTLKLKRELAVSVRNKQP